MAFDGRLLGGVSVLAAVVETGNFVRAAEALGLKLMELCMGPLEALEKIILS
jgi:hypothetical protein